MKVVTWNCNLRLKDKYELLQSLNPDIAIIQECEELPTDYFPKVKYIWHGFDSKKGIGVLSFGHHIELDEIHNQNFIYFLPIKINGGNFKLLSVWAYNHRAKKRFGNEYNGQTIYALQHYSVWLQDKNSIIAGDFNHSIIWDKQRNENNFSNINELLDGLGFHSSYHTYYNHDFGNEPQGTFFHTKKQDKPYHIDYIFTKFSTELESVNIGSYEEWIKYSDHVPVSIEIKSL